MNVKVLNIMASSAVHIKNMQSAIDSGNIPGKFNKNKTEFTFNTLEYVDSHNATHFWTIKVRLLLGKEYVPITNAILAQEVLENYKGEITVESLQKDGKIRDVVPTYVNNGKNIGKKNATNCITQAIRDALGLYNKQNKRTNALHFATQNAAQDVSQSRPPPMLVKKIGDSQSAILGPEDFISGITAQRKLNGVHFVVYKHQNELIRYSRTGTLYPGQDQIVVEMLAMMDIIDSKEYRNSKEYDISAYNDPHFDGELYVHGKSLNWISGQARRADDAGNLEFHIFDVFFPNAQDMESRHRQDYIDTFFRKADEAGIKHPHIIRVENFKVESLEKLNALAKRFLTENYEGAIARKDKSGYQYGYRNYHSSNLVKIKPIFDDEFTVVGYSQGTRGKDVGAVIWECEVPKFGNSTDNLFTVVPKDMTYSERYAIYKCLGTLVDGPNGKKITRFERDIKGLPLTVEYSEMSTKTGKPLQAKALSFRTYESGPALDPIKTLMEDCLRIK